MCLLLFSALRGLIISGQMIVTTVPGMDGSSVDSLVC